MWKRVQIWVAFASSCQRSWRKKTEKSYTRLNHFQTHLSNCSKQPAKQMKTLTLPQNPHINGHDGDHYTADKEDQLMTLSMLQEKFQDGVSCYYGRTRGPNGTRFTKVSWKFSQISRHDITGVTPNLIWLLSRCVCVLLRALATILYSGQSGVHQKLAEKFHILL